MFFDVSCGDCLWFKLLKEENSKGGVAVQLLRLCVNPLLARGTSMGPLTTCFVLRLVGLKGVSHDGIYILALSSLL